MSGNVVIDPAYWNAVAAYLAASGVATYEQDWLDDKAHTDFNLNDGEAFLGNMASAMAAQKLTVQYCMAAAGHFLESTNHNSVTSVRASQDRLVPDRWMEFLYTSRLASALGLWPFTDNFLSSETSNLLLATLSAGPVGLSDPIGGLNAANLLHAVRKDGIIVKPDVPLIPLDRSYAIMAGGMDVPQVAATYSDFDGVRTQYVLAFSRGSNLQASFHPAELGLDTPAYLYDYFSGAGRLVNPGDEIAQPIVDEKLYWIGAPVGPSGIAILGDLDQFVPMGKKRVRSYLDNGVVELTIVFADGETSRTITGYAPFRPAAHALYGSVNPLRYHTGNKRFQIAVMPGPDGIAKIRIRLPQRQAPAFGPPPRIKAQ
jgi:hypothetical protein